MENLKTKISAIKVGLSVASLAGSIAGNKMIVDLTNDTIIAIDKIDLSQNEAGFMIEICLKQYATQLQLIATQPMAKYEIGGISMNKSRQNGIIDNSGKIINNESN